jgi:hypothetical protein
MGSALRESLGRVLRAPESWAYVLLLAAYVVVRSSWFADLPAVAYRDTESYLEVASRPLLSPDFWAGARAWTVPLLYKLLPDTQQALTTGHLVVSLACWAALAAAVARCLRPAASRVVAFAAVLAFSMSLAVIRWDRLLLSESVSIALTALVVAAWLELVRAPRRGAVAGVLAASLLWVFSRDTNGLLVLLTALPALIWLARPGRLGRRWVGVLAAGLVAIFAASVAASRTDEAQLRRNDRPMLHVVGRRVLVRPELERYFRAHGMPAPTPRVRRYRKQLAAIGDTIPSDPQTDRFLAWVRNRAQGTLARYLVTHPAAAMRPMIRFRKRLLRGVTIGYLPPGARPLLPKPVAGILYPDRVRGVLRWLAIVSAVAFVAALAGAGRWTWLVPVGVILLQLPHALLVYHGDTLEVARHAVVMAIMLRLGILLMALLVLGSLVERLAARASRARPAVPGDSTDVRLPPGPAYLILRRSGEGCCAR